MRTRTGSRHEHPLGGMLLGDPDDEGMCDCDRYEETSDE